MSRKNIRTPGFGHKLRKEIVPDLPQHFVDEHRYSPLCIFEADIEIDFDDKVATHFLDHREHLFLDDYPNESSAFEIDGDRIPVPVHKAYSVNRLQFFHQFIARPYIQLEIRRKNPAGSGYSTDLDAHASSLLVCLIIFA